VQFILAELEETGQLRMKTNKISNQKREVMINMLTKSFISAKTKNLRNDLLWNLILNVYLVK
jgi:hypothetical protein